LIFWAFYYIFNNRNLAVNLGGYQNRMKKILSILLSAILTFSLMMPAFATSSYPDVPNYHWAVNAINMLSALGIIEGYPDGTFKGQNSITRYEMALMVARLLDYMEQQISEKLEEVEDRVGNYIASGPSLNINGADMGTIEKVILDKIAEMDKEKWDDFDNKLTILFNGVEDIYAKIDFLESSGAKQSELASRELEFNDMKAAMADNNESSANQLNAKLSGVVATVDALETEFKTELNAFGVKRDNLTNELNNSKDAVSEISSAIRSLENKVNVNEKNIKTLYKLIAEAEAELEAIKKSISQSYNDLLDIKTTAKIDAATAEVQNARMIDYAKRIKDLEYDQTNLEVKFNQSQNNLTSGLEHAKNDISELDTQITGLTKRLDGSLIDKMNINGSFTTEVNHLGITSKAGASTNSDTYYANLFTGDKILERTADLTSTLAINTQITPKDNAQIDLSLRLTSNLYKFGKNLNNIELNGTMSLNVKTETYLAQIYSGVLKAPSIFTDFTAGSKKFNDAKNTGISINMQFGKSKVDGVFAKLTENTKTATDFKYLYALGGTYELIEDNAEVGLRGIVYTDVAEAGDTTTSNQNATISANYGVKINDTTSTTGEIALFKNENPGFKTALKVDFLTKLFDTVNIKVEFDKVEKGYDPYYKNITADSQKLNVNVTLPEIVKGVTINGTFDMNGNDLWSTKKVRAFGVEALYNNANVFETSTGLKVEAGVDFIKDIVVKDPTYSVISVSADVENDLIMVEASEEYNTKDSSHILAANVDFNLIKDVFSVGGGVGTKIVAGDSIYTKYNVGADLSLTLVENVLSAAFKGGYYNKNYNTTIGLTKDDWKTAYKGYAVDADIIWKVMNGMTITGNIGKENRNYQKNSMTTRSGFINFAGLILNQQLLDSTKLNVGFDVKYFNYDNSLNLNDYWTRTFTLNLNTTF